MAQAGFQLIELMIVLTIAGILLTAAIPNFTRLTSRSRVESAASDVHRTLVLARQKALARRVPYRVMVIAGGQALRVERRDDGAWVADPVRDLLIPESLEMTTSFGGQSTNIDLIIEPQGTIRAEDAPAVFRFGNARGDSASVRAVRTGRIRADVH